MPFDRRGAILDEQLEAMHQLWQPSPASYRGECFRFDDVYCEPKPFRSPGPTLWFGGQRLHPAIVRRLVRYGSGFHPFGEPSDDELAHLDAELRLAGRNPADIEMIGGTRAVFHRSDDVADVDAAMSDFARQWQRGCATFCLKPSQHTDDLAEVGAICRHMVDAVGRLVAGPDAG